MRAPRRTRGIARLAADGSGKNMVIGDRNETPRAEDDRAGGQGDHVTMVGLVKLLPLTLLMITGLYLFVLPHVTRNDRRPRSDS